MGPGEGIIDPPPLGANVFVSAYWKDIEPLFPDGDRPPLVFGQEGAEDFTVTIDKRWFLDGGHSAAGWRWWSVVLLRALNAGFEFEMTEVQQGLVHRDGFRFLIPLRPTARERSAALRAFVATAGTGRRPQPLPPRMPLQ